MAVTGAYLLPHPPIIIPEIGKNNLQFVEKTIRAAKEIREEILAENYGCFFLVSPHLHGDINTTFVYEGSMGGSLSQFGAPSVKVKINSATKYVAKLELECSRKSMSVKRVLIDDDKFLDHGSVVPLHYIFKEKEVPVIPVSVTGGQAEYNYAVGRAIKTVSAGMGKCALLVSGDLSHRLSKAAPAGYSPAGAAFDQKIAEIFQSNNLKQFTEIDEDFASSAGHCGLPGLQIMAGVMDSEQVTCKIHSYEGPFGVGYMVTSVKTNER